MLILLQAVCKGSLNMAAVQWAKKSGSRPWNGSFAFVWYNYVHVRINTGFSYCIDKTNRVRISKKLFLQFYQTLN